MKIDGLAKGGGREGEAGSEWAGDKGRYRGETARFHRGANHPRNDRETRQEIKSRESERNLGLLGADSSPTPAFTHLVILHFPRHCALYRLTNTPREEENPRCKRQTESEEEKDAYSSSSLDSTNSLYSKRKREESATSPRDEERRKWGGQKGKNRKRTST